MTSPYRQSRAGPDESTRCSTSLRRAMRRLGWLLPYRRYVAISRLPPVELMAAIGSATSGSGPFWSLPLGHEDFDGTVQGDGFDLRLIGTQRVPLAPRIRGLVVADEEGSRITVVMAPHPFELAFVCLWLGSLTIAAIAVASRGNPAFVVSALAAPGLLYGLFLKSFLSESSHARLLLTRTSGARWLNVAEPPVPPDVRP
jgi:hypothetical protein